MSLTIQITAENPADLHRAVQELAGAFGGLATFATAVEGALPAADGKGVTLALDTAEDKPAEGSVVTDKPAEDKPVNQTAEGSVVKDKTPAEMRAEGSDMLMKLFNADPTKAPVLRDLQAKYGVRKFADIPDERAAEFYHDAVLASNGTAEVQKAA